MLQITTFKDNFDYDMMYYGGNGNIRKNLSWYRYRFISEQRSRL